MHADPAELEREGERGLDGDGADGARCPGRDLLAIRDGELEPVREVLEEVRILERLCVRRQSSQAGGATARPRTEPLQGSKYTGSSTRMSSRMRPTVRRTTFSLRLSTLRGKRLFMTAVSGASVAKNRSRWFSSGAGSLTFSTRLIPSAHACSAAKSMRTRYATSRYV